MSLCGQKSMYVVHSLIPSPDRSWLLGPGGVGHVKEPIRGRLNLDDEIKKLPKFALQYTVTVIYYIICPSVPGVSRLSPSWR